MNEELMVKENMRLVYKIAGKYPKHCKLPMEDRVQEGCIGLLRAIREYDESKGIKFGTFAGQHIQWAISNAMRVENPVKVSTDVTQLIAHIHKNELQDLSVEELMSRTKESRTVVEQALSYMKVNFESLDFKVGLDHGGVVEHYENVGYEEDFETRLLLRKCLEHVPPKAMRFLILHIQGYTLVEIGKMRGTSRQSVHNHIAKARKKLQERRAELLEV